MYGHELSRTLALSFISMFLFLPFRLVHTVAILYSMFLALPLLRSLLFFDSRRGFFHRRDECFGSLRFSCCGDLSLLRAGGKDRKSIGMLWNKLH